jgi:RHS repeat-associated protein
MVGLIAGLVAGAVIGALCVATGGAALIAVAAVAGAAAGGGIGEVLGSLSCLPLITTGMIQTGSPNVHTNSRAATRAHLDVDICSGMPPFGFPSHPINPIAQGSKTVHINSWPASRVGDLTVCSAKIQDGSNNVRIGGPTATTDKINPEIPQWINDTLMVVGFVAACILAGPVVAILGFAASMIGGEIGSYYGGKWFGEGSDGQKLMGLGGSILGGMLVGGAAKTFEDEPVIAPRETEPIVEPEAIGPKGEPESVGPKAEDPVSEQPSCADPVNIVTGEVLMWRTDFVLPGALPVELKRNYASNLSHSSCFGPHWASTWGQYVEAPDSDTAEVIYYAADGRRIAFEVPAEEPGDWMANPYVNRLRMRRIAEGFEVLDDQRRTLRFASSFGGRWLLSAIEDPNGSTILFSYDTTGALREVTHSGGYRLQVEGTSAQIRRVTLAGEELIRYEYDAAGMLAAVIDGSGLPFRYFYDQHGRAVRWEDRKGVWYQYRLDDRGRCIEAQGPDCIYHYRLLYDEASRTTVVIDSHDRLAVYIHNAQGRVVERRDARGGVTVTEWDERGNRLKETDPEGRTTVREYDGNGQLTAIQDGLGRRASIEYDSTGSPVKLVDPNSKEWVRSYDDRGNLIEAKGPDGRPWSYERDGLGNVVRVIDPENRVREFGYDRRGLQVWTTDWQGARTELTRDARGRVTEAVDPLGRHTQFGYNQQGKLANASLPDGARLRWEYDAEENVTRRIGPDGHEFGYTYGPFDLLSEVQKPSGGRLQLRYDTETRLRQVENELGQVWRYEYNETGQVVREVDFHGREQQYEYDGSGLCIKRVNGAGEETAFSRDAAGQLVAKQCSDGSTSEFAYDPLGRVIRAAADGAEVTLKRDDYGRVLQEIQPAGLVRSDYDSRGLRVRRQTATYETEWEWDANGRAVRLKSDGDELLAFARDAVGREVERKMRGGVVLRQEFDALDRLISQTASAGAAPVERQYEYDRNGDPLEIRDGHWGSSQFDYDADGRIAKALRQGGKSEAFEYGPAGEMIAAVRAYADGGMGQQTRDYGADGRLVRVGRTEYSWDADGRLIAKQEDDRQWRYEWTADGRLKGVETPEGERWQYQYDAFGRRVRKTGPKETVDYTWDDGVVAEETRGQRVTAWEFEPGSFRPLGKRETRTEFDACVTDQVGTPRELVNQHGQVVWRAAFNTWGELDQLGERKTDCPIRFQGQWWDEETGLAYNFNRYYEPASASYISPDPIGLDGGTRTYGYVHNPLSWIDPWGLACANVDNQGVLNLKNKFSPGSAEDTALQQHVADWNQEIQNQGGSMTRQAVTPAMRAQADQAAAAARAANPSQYPAGMAAGHTPDVGWGGNPAGPINPLNSTVNSYVGGATQAVPVGTTYNSVVLY